MKYVVVLFLIIVLAVVVLLLRKQAATRRVRRARHAHSEPGRPRSARHPAGGLASARGRGELRQVERRSDVGGSGG